MPAIIDNLKFIESDYSPSNELCMYDLCRPDQITKRKEFDWRERACTMITEVAAAADVIASEKKRKSVGGKMWKKVLRVKILLHFNIARPSVSLSRRRWWCRAIIIMIMAIARLSVVWRLRAFLIQFFIKSGSPHTWTARRKIDYKKHTASERKKKTTRVWSRKSSSSLVFPTHKTQSLCLYWSEGKKSFRRARRKREIFSMKRKKKLKMKEKIVLFKKQHHRDRVEREAGLFREKL